MNASRYGLYTGTICTLPVVVWMLVQNPAQLNGFEWQATTLLAIKALYITLAIAIALFIPWHARQWQWLENSTGAIVLVLIAMPLMTITWLSAAVTAEILLRGLTGLVAFALTVLCLAKGIELFRFVAGVKAFMRVTLQLILATMSWTFSNFWLHWVGL